MGTLLHSKIILELLLQNDKPQAFSKGEIPPQPPSSRGGDPLDPPLTLIKDDYKKEKGIYLK